MNNRRTATAAAAVALCAAGAFGAAGPAQASGGHGSRVVGHTYVNDNASDANTIAAFDRHADGSLTPTTGSPFATGGVGLGVGLGSQGAIQESSDGRFLLAVNAGSNDISVLRLDRNGVPQPVGAPTPSGGVKPVSVTVHGDLVYVANSGAGGANYSGFRLRFDGRLVALPGATYPVPDDAGLAEVAFDASGDRLIGTRDGPATDITKSLIDSFAVQPDGTLQAPTGSPYRAQGNGPIGAAFNPVDDRQLFVANAHDGPGLGTVSAFHVDRRGRISPLSAAPFPNLQTAPCWVEISHDGKVLFSVNTASATVSSYAIASNGTLTLVGSYPFRNGAGAVDARLSPDGTTLSVTGGRGQVVTVFAVTGATTLTEVASSPTPLPTAGTSPTGIVVT